MQRHETINFGITRSMVKVTQRRNRSEKSLSARQLKNYPTTSNETWQHAHITYAHVVSQQLTRCKTSKIKVTQDHK